MLPWGYVGAAEAAATIALAAELILPLAGDGQVRELVNDTSHGKVLNAMTIAAHQRRASTTHEAT